MPAHTTSRVRTLVATVTIGTSVTIAAPLVGPGNAQALFNELCIDLGYEFGADCINYLEQCNPDIGPLPVWCYRLR